MDSTSSAAVIGAKAVEGVLSHYGKKGMKWGVRNDRGYEGQKAKTKTIEKADKKFEKEINAANSGRSSADLHNAVVGRMNSRIRDINDKPEYRDLDRATPELRSKYDNEMKDTIVKSFEDGVREVYGSNASGTKKGVYNSETDQIDIVDREVQHAQTRVPNYVAKLTRNDSGYITSVKFVELDEKGAELAHYGVKGMRWGYRKTEGGGVEINQTKVKKSLRKTDQPITVTQRKAGTFVRAQGGKRQTASDDAVKTQAVRQKAKKSTTDALSNKELKDSIERMRLEQEFARLNKQVSRKGSGFVSRFLQTPEARQATADLLKRATAANNQ
jgi:hypothetical protein